MWPILPVYAEEVPLLLKQGSPFGSVALCWVKSFEFLVWAAVHWDFLLGQIAVLVLDPERSHPSQETRITLSLLSVVSLGCERHHEFWVWGVKLLTLFDLILNYYDLRVVLLDEELHLLQGEHERHEINHDRDCGAYNCSELCFTLISECW